MTDDPLDPRVVFADIIPEGWEYRDIPWCLGTMWAELMGILGDDNYRIIAMSQRTAGDGALTCRGQVLISPQGMANLVAYSDAQRNAESPS